MKSINKTIYLPLVIIIATLLFTSCGDDYLDREPSDYLTGEQIKEYATLNPEIPAGIIRGVYTNTFSWGTGGSGDHDDFGQKSIDIVSDTLALSVEKYSGEKLNFRSEITLESISFSHDSMLILENVKYL